VDVFSFITAISDKIEWTR